MPKDMQLITPRGSHAQSTAVVTPTSDWGPSLVPNSCGCQMVLLFVFTFSLLHFGPRLIKDQALSDSPGTRLD